MKKNKIWVKRQFEILDKNVTNGYRLYRDTILITSFIETIIRSIFVKKDGKYKYGFKESLEKLGLEIKPDESISSYKENCQYKDGCLIEINRLRVYRNELIHEIINKDLPEKYINSIIHEMSKKIEFVCNNSNLFRDYFKNNYQFDPKEIIEKKNT